MVVRLLGMIVGHRMAVVVDMMTEARQDQDMVGTMIEDHLLNMGVLVGDTMREDPLPGTKSVGDMVVAVEVSVGVTGREEDHPVRQDVGDTECRRKVKNLMIRWLDQREYIMLTPSQKE